MPRDYPIVKSYGPLEFVATMTTDKRSEYEDNRAETFVTLRQGGERARERERETGELRCLYIDDVLFSLVKIVAHRRMTRRKRRREKVNVRVCVCVC
jgi:hypothetical protein